MSKTINKVINGEAEHKGIIARSALYACISKYSKQAINVLVELLNSRNQYIRLGAAKAILDKTIPDIRPIEIKQELDKPVLIQIIRGNGYLPPEIKSELEKQ